MIYYDTEIRIRRQPLIDDQVISWLLLNASLGILLRFVVLPELKAPIHRQHVPRLLRLNLHVIVFVLLLYLVLDFQLDLLVAEVSDDF